MKTLESPRPVPQVETDRQMLAWLREQLSHFKEGGYGRHYSDAVVARFGELIENQNAWKRMLSTVEDAHALAIKQMEFAQSALRQLEKQVESLESQAPPARRNGKTQPAIELQGE